tara:strand:+ start:9079 stop:10269 length:1191 start_codon:yes stop_codon:yes gene_type:complete
MRKLQLAIALSSTFYGGTLVAQEAASIDVGGFDLFPSVQLDVLHDSNVIRSNDDEIDSWATTIAPEFILVNSYGLNEVQAGYRLTKGDYFSSKEDDYLDHFLFADVSLDFDVRNRLNVFAEYEDGHDDRGTGFSIGSGELLSSPDTYKYSNVSGTYSYGVLTSKGRVDFTLGYSGKDYDLDTDIYRTRDRNTVNVASTFYYNIMPATDLTLDIIYNNINYDFAIDPTSPLDSKEVRTLIGVEWDTSAKTTGYFKVGHRQKEFDDNTREDFSGLDWRVGVTWNPKTYSTIDFTTFTNTNETNGVGDFIDTHTYRLTWDHEWLDRISTTFRASYSKDEYTGSGATRVDDNTAATFAVNYQAQRYMVIAAGFTHDRRNSNQDAIDFDRNIVSLTLNVTL